MTPIRLHSYSGVVKCAVPAKTAGSATTDSLPFAEEAKRVQFLTGLTSVAASSTYFRVRLVAASLPIGKPPAYSIFENESIL